MLANLQAEMKRNGLNSLVIANAIGKSDKTVRDKISERTQFDIYEAMSIRDKFFPGLRLEYLFARGKSTVDA